MKQTPWEAMQDPFLPFNMTVYRTAMVERRMKLNEMEAQLSGEGEGFAKLYNMVRRMVEDQ